MNEIEQRAAEKAFHMRTLDRLDRLEKTLDQHNEVLIVGNGKPAIRHEVRTSKERIAALEDDIVKQRETNSKIDEVHKWMQKQMRAEELAATERKRWGDQAKEFMLKNFLQLVQTGAIGLLGYMWAAGKLAAG